jgi:uncharacterized membrane protein YkoI
MRPTTKKIAIGTAIAGAAVIVGVAAGGAATAADSGGTDGSDTVLSGTALDRASEAALAETGGGVVVDSEAEEESAYEVEVNLDDGRQIEVHLDANFAVVDSSENEEGDDSGEPDDDD